MKDIRIALAIGCFVIGGLLIVKGIKGMKAAKEATKEQKKDISEHQETKEEAKEQNVVDFTKIRYQDKDGMIHEIEAGDNESFNRMISDRNNKLIFG